MSRALLHVHALHALRVVAALAAYALATSGGHFIFAALAAVAGYLAGFAWAHDLSHGRLGLAPRLHDGALATAGLLMLLSGHAMRRLHLRHHVRPLAADDVEGAVIEGPLAAAIVALPRLLVAARREAWRGTRTAERAWQVGENAAVLLVVALVPGLAIYAGVAFAMQLGAPLWAGRLSHRRPAFLVRAARCLIFTRSAAVLSLVFHDLHHERPRVPCHQLADLAEKVGA
jgi:hypothetical protein